MTDTHVSGLNPDDLTDRSVPMDEVARRLWWVQILMFVLFPIVYALIWQDNPLRLYNADAPTAYLPFEFPIPQLLLIGTILVGIIIHEGLHAFGFMLGGAKVRDIQFGIILEALAPYAHSRVPLRARSYAFAVLLPGLLTGLIPSLLALALGDVWLLWFGSFMFGAAVGDALILYLLTRESGNPLVLDHESQAGYYLVREGYTPAK
ncbi:MAG: DUF3267 domain-containing protein [Chloroflexi bacterium]|nr:DUF3267 domain-containing protein [Chloroflexota bacterium]